MVEGIELVPRREVAYRGVTIEEMDLDAILARKPELCVVDEIPHTNVPGSKNRKRYQDVLDILAAGINVIGALNIQHLESLKDVVEKATGVAIHETVPDSFLNEAVQVVNLDLAVEDLLERLRSGKIYAADKVSWALEHFFKDANLNTLRELALREVAESLERQSETKARTTAGEPRGANSRVLVCMSSYPPHAEALLRKGSRMAGRLSGDWFVVYVETPREAPDRIDSEAQRHLLANIELARELGAEVVRLQARDPVPALIDFARSHGGRPHRDRSIASAVVETGPRALGTVASAPGSRRSRRPHRVAPRRRARGRTPVRMRTKLVLAQLPLVLALGITIIVGSSVTRALGRGSQDILKDNYRSVIAAERMKDAAERIDSGLVFAIIGRASRGLDQIAQYIPKLEDEIRVQEHNITEPGEREATAKLRKVWNDYRDAIAEVRRVPDAAGLDGRYFDSLLGKFLAVKDAADVILVMNQDAMMAKSDRAERLAGTSNTLLVVVSLAGLFLGLIASGIMTTRVLRPLSVLGQTARRLGEGDVAVRARVGRSDEIGELAVEINTMAERIQKYRESSLGELVEAQLAAQATIDSLPDPVLVVALDGELRHANQAAETILHARAEAGVNGLAVLDPAIRGAVERMRQHVAAGRGAYVPKGLDEAIKLPGVDGERLLLPRAAPLYAEEGDVVGATVVFQDVTRLHRFEELSSDLVATVAHELRTPLTSLRMAVHLLAEETVGPLTPKQADLVFAAREECDRLQSIVDELLDLSRIEADRIELRLAAQDPETVVRDAIESQRASASEAKVQLRSEVLPDTPEVMIDRERIQLVLANLIGNAIRYGGNLVTLRAVPSTGWIRFEVADEGPGVMPEYQQTIFDKYVRVPGSRAGGAGLGLFISREIVRAHGGEIGVESEPGHGATFWFTVKQA